MENKRLSYLIVEDLIINSPVLTKEDKIFYIALKSFRNRQSKRCFPALRRVIDRAQISKPTAYKCRAKLKALGVISWASEKGRKHSCHYRFILEDGEEV